MASNPQPIERTPSTAMASLLRSDKRIRAVVVDDSPEFCDVACALLEMDGYVEVVGTASDGFAALEAVDDLNPNLVLMDVHMPGMDGLAAAELICARCATTNVVLMSAEYSEEMREQAEANGARALIFKAKLRSQLSGVLAENGLYPQRH